MVNLIFIIVGIFVGWMLSYDFYHKLREIYISNPSFKVWFKKVFRPYYLIDLVLIPIISIFIFWIGARHYIGFEEIGLFFEKWEYSTYYEVGISQVDSDDKYYTLEGKIDAMGKKYFLREVYWPNGGWSTFNDCLLDYEYGNPHCYDNQGREWEIEVGEKAK